MSKIKKFIKLFLNHDSILFQLYFYLKYIISKLRFHGLTEEFVATYRDGSAEVAGIDELISRMEADEFDLIAVGRALLANPNWADKIRNNDMDSIETFSKEQLTELV